MLLESRARLASRFVWFAACWCLASCAASPQAGESLEFARAMNRGKAHLENGEAAMAIEAFRNAVVYAPESAPAPG